MFNKVSFPICGLGLALLFGHAGLCQGSPEASCIVAGHVTDGRSGQKIRNAALELTALDNPADTRVGTGSQHIRMALSEGRVRYGTVSGAGGEFCFSSVPPGQYVLSAKKAGFLDSSYGTTSPSQLSAILHLQPGQSLDVAVRLLPHATISGKVIGSDGEPVDTGMVQLISTVWLRGKPRRFVVKGVAPNDRGEYRLAGLQPGTYYVRFQPRSPDASPNVTDPGNRESAARPIPTYYVSVMTLAEAVAIQIGLGEDASGRDVVMRQAVTYTVKGRLMSSGRSPEFASVTLVSQGEETTTLAVGNNTLGPDGTFRFLNVAPGAYKVYYLVGAGQGISVGAAEVNVADQDVTDVLIDAGPPVSLEGTVTIEGATKAEISGAKVHLMAADGLMGPNCTAAVQSGGGFMLKDCSPGRYTVSVTAPATTYLREARYGSADITNERVTIGGAGAELKIILRHGTARLKGRIALPESDSGGGQGFGGAYYVAAPVGPSFEGPGVRFGHSDSAGAFLIEDLPPGRYAVVAFVAPDTGALQNPSVLDALRPIGTEIELRENEEATITVRLISAEEGGRIFSLGR